MIDLFRPYMSPNAARMVAATLAPDNDGRVYIGQGPNVDMFEEGLAKVLGTPEPPLALNSCTSALELALHLIGVGPGDEVISTPLTCTATNGAIARTGAEILWADCDPVTGLITPEGVWEAGGRSHTQVKAIMAVDWGGRLCQYDRLRGFGLPVIQDAAHSLLAGGPMVAGGDYVCWSFQAIKHLTTGDGGALLCPPSQMERARLLRWYGLDRRSSADFRCAQDIQEIGWKCHMNDIAAAIGLANIGMARWVVERHRENAAYYHEALAGIPGLMLPPPDPGSSWWLYSILVEDQADFIRTLAEEGIAASPVHARNDKHTAFKAVSETRGPLPGVDHFAAHEVAIPVHWALSEQEREYVADRVAMAVKRRPLVMA